MVMNLTGKAKLRLGYREVRHASKRDLSVGPCPPTRDRASTKHGQITTTTYNCVCVCASMLRPQAFAVFAACFSKQSLTWLWLSKLRARLYGLPATAKRPGIASKMDPLEIGILGAAHEQPQTSSSHVRNRDLPFGIDTSLPPADSKAHFNTGVKSVKSPL